MLSFARYFTETRREGGLRFRDLLIPLLMVVVPFRLIAKQPDLGTALVLFFVALHAYFRLRLSVENSAVADRCGLDRHADRLAVSQRLSEGTGHHLAEPRFRSFGCGLS